MDMNYRGGMWEGGGGQGGVKGGKWDNCKSIINKYILKNDKKVWEDGIIKLPKGSRTKMGNILLSKVIAENEKCVFSFYFKIENLVAHSILCVVSCGYKTYWGNHFINYINI